MTTKIISENVNQGRVKVPNGELYFESIGTGEPLILIHAGFSDRRDWQHQTADFGKKFNVIVYDQRGSGNLPKLMRLTLSRYNHRTIFTS